MCQTKLALAGVVWLWSVAYASVCFGDPKQAYAHLMATEQAQAQPVLDINTATAAQFLTLQGVGAVTAEAIVAYRARVGRFERVEDLLQVKGIGVKTLEKNRHRLSVYAPK